MKKIIWNSILATLLGTLALCVVLVFACVCFFPPTVMEFAYSVGWESTAMKYAERSYNRFGDAYYIAYAMEIAADEELDEDTERYAESLIAHKDFESYCEGIDAKSFYIDENGNRTDEKLKSTYKQHVYVNLCTAKYRLGKKDESFRLAYESLGGKFPPNNSLAAVLMSALKAGDTETAEKISVLLESFDVSALAGLTQEDLEAADAEYLAAMKYLIAVAGAQSGGSEG